ncbi:MAG: hypothetical protein AAF799_22440 [Myxococcota bacterium]
MGAYDTYAGKVQCPACGDFIFLLGQTKVFDPDFGGLYGRRFAVGVEQPLSFPPSTILAEPSWDYDWWRVQEPSPPGRLALLVDLDDMRVCPCGRPLVIVLRFAIDDAGPSATLESIDLYDALEDDVGAHVDLADLAGMFASAEELAALTPEQRAGRLREALAEVFEGFEGGGLGPPSPWTDLWGPMRCEHCGVTRTRTLRTMLSHHDYVTSVLGPRWHGGTLEVGTRIETSTSWREVDEDRGYFVRLRHPLPPDTLTICGWRESFGCSCDAGSPVAIARFRVDDTGMVLESVSLRVLRTERDLDDIDFAFSPMCSRGRLAIEGSRRKWVPADRSEAIECVKKRFGLGAS